MENLEARADQSLQEEIQDPKYRFLGSVNAAIGAHCSKDWPQDQQEILREGVLDRMLLADSLLGGQWRNIEINLLMYEMGEVLSREHKQRKYQKDLFWDIKKRLDYSRIRPGTKPRDVFITTVRKEETGRTPQENKREEAEKIRRAKLNLWGISGSRKLVPQDRLPFNRDGLYLHTRRVPKP